MINKEQLMRLNKFLNRKHARQRIILYLLANNYSIKQICEMKFKELDSLTINLELNSYREEIKSIAIYNDKYNPNKLAFTYPGGLSFTPQDIYRIVRQATKIVFGESRSIDDFVTHVRKNE